MLCLAPEALCRAPCVYMIKNGYCENGFACKFCHLPHGKKVRLNKFQRDCLKDLSQGQDHGSDGDVADPQVWGPCWTMFDMCFAGVGFHVFCRRVAELAGLARPRGNDARLDPQQ